MAMIAGGSVGGFVVGGLLGLLGREISILLRRIARPEKRAALRRELPR